MAALLLVGIAIGGLVLRSRALDRDRRAVVERAAIIPGSHHGPATRTHPAWHRGSYDVTAEPDDPSEPVSEQAVDAYLIATGWTPVGHLRFRKGGYYLDVSIETYDGRELLQLSLNNKGSTW